MSRGILAAYANPAPESKGENQIVSASVRWQVAFQKVEWCSTTTVQEYCTTVIVELYNNSSIGSV